MTARDLYDAFGFPESTRLGKRVFKKHLLDNGNLTAADKRSLSDTVGAITWQYTLKPATIAIKSFRDSEREYDEIALLEVEIESRQRVERLAEIFHRTIPYPLLLVFVDNRGVQLSAAPKRIHLSERERIVVEYFEQTTWLEVQSISSVQRAFLQSLAIGALPNLNFQVLYDAWLQRIVALQCAELSGAFRLYSSSTVAERRDALASCRGIEREIRSLRTAIRAETSFARKLELNTEIKSLEIKLQKDVAEL
jgi:hypothetical protein